MSDRGRDELDPGRATAMPTRSGLDTPEGGADRSPTHGRPGRVTGVYACLFLVFLAFPLVTSWTRGDWHRPLGLLTVVLFCAWYAAGYFDPRIGWRDGAGLRQWSIWGWLAGLVLLTLLLAVSAGAYGISGLTYVACGGAALTPLRVGFATVIAAGLATGAGGLLTGMDALIALAVGGWVTLIGLMVWGSIFVGRQHEVTLTAREERAALAVEVERLRMARDLHDILGHSLTVIAVKGELAGRLIDVDPVRAKAELADLERLARDALRDVRSTVSNYRRLSLPQELVQAGRALAAAGIVADIPSAADEVPTALRDPFAWVVREGVTNVIRHSGASTCTILLSPTSVEVRDDGRVSSCVQAGNGLTGLQERGRQAGLTIVAGPSPTGGFSLHAQEDE